MLVLLPVGLVQHYPHSRSPDLLQNLLPPAALKTVLPLGLLHATHPLVADIRENDLSHAGQASLIPEQLDPEAGLQ